MPLKAVTFDLWLTLIWDSRELEEYRRLRRLINFHRFAKKVGNAGRTDQRITFNSVRLAMEELSTRVKSHYEKGYDVHPEERGRMLFKLLRIKVPPNEDEEVFRSAGEIMSNSGYYTKYPKLNPELKNTFKTLKESFPDLKIGLISNAARSSKTYSRMLRHYGILKYFDQLTISCEVGYLKPRREIFESSLHALSVKPRESLHVGDLFKADVVGATEVGMNAALYTGLWHKYAQYMNPGEHIPKDFKTRTKVLVKEIAHLGDVVDMVAQLQQLML